MFPPYINNSTDLKSRSIDWFLCNGKTGLNRVQFLNNILETNLKLNPLSTSSKKLSNTLKQFAGKLLTDSLSTLIILLNYFRKTASQTYLPEKNKSFLPPIFTINFLALLNQTGHVFLLFLLFTFILLFLRLPKKTQRRPICRRILKHNNDDNTCNNFHKKKIENTHSNVVLGVSDFKSSLKSLCK